MASIRSLLFLALSFSMGCLFLSDSLLAIADQNPNSMGPFISIAIHTALFVLLPVIFFSSIILLIYHVATSDSAQLPLLPVSQTEHVPIELKSLASIRNLSILALTVSFSGLLLFDSLTTVSNQSPNNCLICISFCAVLYVLLPFVFYTAVILFLSLFTM